MLFIETDISYLNEVLTSDMIQTTITTTFDILKKKGIFEEKQIDESVKRILILKLKKSKRYS